MISSIYGRFIVNKFSACQHKAFAQPLIKCPVQHMFPSCGGAHGIRIKSHTRTQTHAHICTVRRDTWRRAAAKGWFFSKYTCTHHVTHETTRRHRARANTRANTTTINATAAATNTKPTLMFIQKQIKAFSIYARVRTRSCVDKAFRTTNKRTRVRTSS